MLNIALIRQRYAQDGGAERFVARALEALKGQDVKVTLITREWKTVEGVEVIVVNPFYLGRVWRDWSFARAVCRVLQERQFDLVQSHERIACCDIYRAGDGVHRAWLEQLKRVRGPLGRLGLALSPYHHYVKWAEQKLFNSPQLKAVICNSRMVKEEIKQYFGTPDSKLHIIYNGVNTETFHPRVRQYRAEVRARFGIPENATLFLFVGSGFERKGVAVLLEAMAQVPGDARLLVVGRDKRVCRYVAKAHALGLAGRVYFTGSQSDVKPFYGAADALVLPTLYDPFPNVIAEALACGLPVVTSTKSGGAELIEHGVDGLVSDALDVSGLADQLRRFLLPETRQAFQAAAGDKVSRLAVQGMTQQFLRLYQTVASAASGRPV